MTKQKFKNVALPEEVYKIARKLAEIDNRSISNLVSTLIIKKNQNK